MANTITVYAFEVFDAGSAQYVVVPHKATIERITRFSDHRIISGTGETVSFRNVDAEGWYHPPADESGSHLAWKRLG
jgi:hypothetical protein